MLQQMGDFPLNPGPLSFGRAPYHIVLGTQLAPGEKWFVCIPVIVCISG